MFGGNPEMSFTLVQKTLKLQGGIWKASGRHLGGFSDGKHLEDLWGAGVAMAGHLVGFAETCGRHLEGLWEAGVAMASSGASGGIRN